MEGSITERLSRCGMGWTALCPAEVHEAVRICAARADCPAQALQVVAAYFYVASCRINSTARAEVPDREVAAAVPRVRGSGFIGEDAYRKRVRPLMEAWGLVRCEQGRPSIRGRPPTTYAFPILECRRFAAEGAAGDGADPDRRHGDDPENPPWGSGSASAS